jgi:peptide/nickel transport system permease protein
VTLRDANGLAILKDRTDDISLLGRFLRGRKWYGAEWYITIAGGLILVAILTMTILTILFPAILPFDPTDNQVGAPFTPPGEGLQVALVRADYRGTIQIPEGLAELEKNPGVVRGSNGNVYLTNNKISRDRYNDIEELLNALESGEIDVALVDASQAPVLLQENADKFRQEGEPFGNRYVLGTDQRGRDMFSRTLAGGKTVLLVALMAAVISGVTGIVLGLASGFWGGGPDRVLSLIMDSIYSFPGLILAIAMAAMLGPGELNIAIAIAVVYIPTYFRVVRGQVLAIKEEKYVEAARSLGARAGVVLFQYIFPNIIPSIVVVFSLNVADAILTEAGLSFIGLGLQEVPDWGWDLSNGQNYVAAGQWWMITFPGIMITLITLGFSLLGEGLSEILNPRLVEG